MLNTNGGEVIKKWKMWASYLDGAKFPVVCMSKWEAYYHKKAQAQPERRVFKVEVKELPRKRRKL